MCFILDTWSAESCRALFIGTSNSNILAFGQRRLLFLSSCVTAQVIGYQLLPFIISFDIGVILMRLPMPPLAASIMA